jgi:hypothetical protein
MWRVGTGLRPTFGLRQRQHPGHLARAQKLPVTAGLLPGDLDTTRQGNSHLCVATVDVLEPQDVVLAEIAADLHLDQP